jgi:exosome complex RNA-binding protein Rrp42 (RNase PH superfamily)
VDPTAEEETCSSASVVMAVIEKSLVTSVFKTGVGSFHPQTLLDILKVCVVGEFKRRKIF